MKDDPGSLDRMHDIVTPEPIPWWPPAPGWYVVIVVAVCVVAIGAFLVWRRWRANAYRRAALRELKSADTVAAISEVLRRTALAASPRSMVAAQLGSEWPDWLAERSPTPMSEVVRQQLTFGPYDRRDAPTDVGELRTYATNWITSHRLDDPKGIKVTAPAS